MGEKQLHESFSLIELKENIDRDNLVIRNVSFLGKKGNSRYSDKALDEAVDFFEGAAVYMEHKTKKEVRDFVGELRENKRDGDRCRGNLHLRRTVSEDIFDMAERFPGKFGLSIMATGKIKITRDGEIVEGFVPGRRKTVDIVADPATVKGLFESKNTHRQLTEGEFLSAYMSKKFQETIDGGTPRDELLKTIFRDSGINEWQVDGVLSGNHSRPSWSTLMSIGKMIGVTSDEIETAAKEDGISYEKIRQFLKEEKLTIEELQQQLAESKKQLEESNSKLADSQKQLEEANSQVTTLTETNKQLEEQQQTSNDSQTSEIQELRKVLLEQEKERSELENRIVKLEEEKSTSDKRAMIEKHLRENNVKVSDTFMKVLMTIESDEEIKTLIEERKGATRKEYRIISTKTPGSTNGQAKTTEQRKQLKEEVIQAVKNK